MRDPTDGRPGGSFYPIKFGVAAIFLVTATLVLVLVVLPRRYVLSSGFRESGVNFPVSATPVSTGILAQRTAPPPPPPLPDEEEERDWRGESEIFWSEVLPLLEADRLDEALALFEEYLSRYPHDRGVRREYALTLFRADRGEEAAAILFDLLDEEDDAMLRLLLARSLRDMGRVAAASGQYATLRDQGEMDSQLALEWARALSWAGRYGAAAEVLVEALERDPEDPALRIELARVLYSAGGLSQARTILNSMDESTLRRFGAIQLRDDVNAALATPPEDRPPPPTLLERAARARTDGEPRESARLYRAALEAHPDDRNAWQSYADLLQYDLEDFAGALAALRQVERLGGGDDPALQYRMAQLEMWTGELAPARDRLEALLAGVERNGPISLAETGAGPGVLDAARLHALLGDLSRWDGDRDEAARHYLAALDANPDNPDAREGFAALRRDVDVAIRETEHPGMGSRISMLRDSDAFLRTDLGAEWTTTRDDWVWSAFAGNRWLEGYDVGGFSAAPSGMFAEMEGARWWRWATIRTAVRLGVESVRPEATDLSFGASALFTDLGTYTLEADYRHGPAYERTTTTEAVFADVVQDEVRVTLTNELSRLWSLWAEARLGRLDARAIPDVPAAFRYEGAVAVGRLLRPGLTMGLSAQALAFPDAAPGAGPRRLWWDPRLVVAAGPYAQFDWPLDPTWRVSGRVSSGLAFMDERPTEGFRRVPQLSGETGLHMELDRISASAEVFYLQTRFEGYRSWGARLSVGLRDLFEDGGRR